MQQYTRSSNVENQFKTEGLTIGWSWRLFVFSIIVFAAAIFLYAGMAYGYEPMLQKNIDEIQKKIDEQSRSKNAGDRENLLSFYSQVFHIKNILAGHLLPSGLFKFVEDNTENKIFYTGARFDQDSAGLVLEGVAQSYEDIVHQLEAFRLRPEVLSINLNNSKIDETSKTGNLNRVTFNLQLVMSKKFLTAQPNQ